MYVYIICVCTYIEHIDIFVNFTICLLKHIYVCIYTNSIYLHIHNIYVCTCIHKSLFFITQLSLTDKYIFDMLHVHEILVYTSLIFVTLFLLLHMLFLFLSN